MDRFQALKIFICVADKGGFAAAAREMNVSPPAVTRAIASLEERIGTRLFVRTTRSVRLSESAVRFFEDCKRILADLEEAEEAAIGTHSEPRGALHISAPVMFGRQYVTPILGDFLQDYPQVSAHTLFVDRMVNLMDEGIDVAVRIGELADSSLHAIRVGEVRRVVFGATGYFKTHDTPTHPRELIDHQIVQSDSVSSNKEWGFRENDRPFKIRLQPRVSMNTNDSVISMVEQGFALSRLLSYQIAGHLSDGRFQAILTDYENAPLPIHVIHQEGRLVSAKVRACVDYFVDRLRADPHLH